MKPYTLSLCFCLFWVLNSCAFNSIHHQPFRGVAADERPVVVITGSSSSLGYEMAQKYLKEGYRVVFASRKAPPTEGLQNARNSIHIATDLRRSQDVRELVDKTMEKWGRIDVLIHNAAYVKIESAMSATASQTLDDSIRTNYIAPVELTQYALEKVEALEHGLKIIYVSSVGSIVPREGFSSYGASKAAGEAHFLSLKRELENLKKIGELKGDHDVSIIRPAFIRSSYAPNISGPSKDVAVTEAVRNLSPTHSKDVVKLVWETSRKKKMPGLVNAGPDAIGTDWARKILPIKIFNVVQETAEKLAVTINKSNACSSIVRTFLTPSKYVMKGDRPLILAALAIVGYFATSDYHGEMKGGLGFLVDFYKKMKKRAELVNQSPSKVQEILHQKGHFMPYEIPVKNSFCDGVFRGYFIMEGGMESFMEHWQHALEIGMGSNHDRMYTDLVHELYESIRGNRVMKGLFMQADDRFYVRMEKGVMTEMQEIINVYQFGINVSTAERFYKRIVDPEIANSFEKTILENGCDADRVAKYYRRIYDPKSISTGMNLEIKFDLEKLPHNSVLYMTIPGEYVHTFDYLGPL